MMEDPLKDRRRGRPRRQHDRLQVTIDIPPDVFDAYYRIARTTRQPLRKVLREVLTKHAHP